MIQPSHFTLAILLMAAITFAVRYLFFTNSVDIKLNHRLKSVLIFTAPCILTAMLTPIMFKGLIDNKDLAMLFTSSYFWAGCCAIILSVFIKNTFLVIALSMIIFYGLRNSGYLS